MNEYFQPKRIFFTFLFLGAFHLLFNCKKDNVSMGSEDSTLHSEYTTTPKEVLIGDRLDISYLLNGIPEGAELSYKLKEETQGIEVSEGGYFLTLNNAEPRLVEVLVNHPQVGVYKAEELTIKIQLKAGFSIKLASAISISKPVAGTRTIELPEYLEGLIKSSKLSYALKQKLAGVSLDQKGGLSIETTVKSGTFEVEISQESSLSHIGGVLLVEVKIKESPTFTYDDSHLSEHTFLEAVANDGSINPVQKSNCKPPQRRVFAEVYRYKLLCKGFAL